MSMADEATVALTPALCAKLRSAAVAGAKHGFSMIRCIPLGKSPRDKKFWESAATTPEAAHALFSEPDGSPSDSNPGIATGTFLPDGRILHVLDVDPKKDGTVSLEQLELEYLDTATFTVQTPSGGLHLYYGIPFDDVIRTSGIDRVAPGIDDRGHHGLVVAPGAITAKGEYRVLKGPDGKVQPILDAPPQLIAALTRPRKETIAAEHLTLVDSLAAIDWSRDYLRSLPKPEHGRRNAEVYNQAHVLREHGISEVLALTLMLEEWDPIPEDAAEVEKAIGSAYRKEDRSGDGSKSAAAQFEDLSAYVSDRPPPKLKARSIRALSFAEMLGLPLWQEAPLVKNLLDAGALSAVYGPPGEGKSFVVMDLGMCIARGVPWAGHQTSQGPVYYVTAEGAGGLGKRIRAQASVHDLTDTFPPFYAYNQAIDMFTSDEDVHALIKDMSRIATSIHAPFRLVIIDTLARVMPGGDENAAKDVGAVIARADEIRDATGAHVLVVHHTGKDRSKGMRGSSALLGAVDTVISVLDKTIAVEKQRNVEQLAKLYFRLNPVPLGNDPDGGLIGSAVPIFHTAPISPPDDLPDDAATVDDKLEQDVEIALLRLIKETDENRRAGGDGWVNLSKFRRGLVTDSVVDTGGSAEADRKRAGRVMDALVRLGRAKYDETKQRVMARTDD